MADPQAHRKNVFQTLSVDQHRIRFDRSGIKKPYPDTYYEGKAKEEIIPNFGLSQSWEQQNLTTPISLSSHAARRLAMFFKTGSYSSEQ